MFRLAICDDEAHSLAQIISLIKEYRLISPFTFEYADFHNGFDLISALEQGKHFDVYCLDIVMPRYNGIELGKEIRKHDKSARIIFLTSSPEFALDSYSVKAENYILKPIHKETLFNTLNDIFEQTKQEEESFITVKDTHGIQKILLSNLVYAEAMGRKVLFHLSFGRTLECSLRFSEACSTLLEYPFFVKPHRSYIVNMNYIDIIENTEIILQPSGNIPIAQGKGKEVKDIYLSFQMRRD